MPWRAAKASRLPQLNSLVFGWGEVYVNSGNLCHVRGTFGADTKTRFRIWATQRLREYIVKGFAMDDERLKPRGGGNYFEELLARIRDIRSSGKEFWRKGGFTRRALTR